METISENLENSKIDGERNGATRSVFDASAPIENAPLPSEYVAGFVDGFDANVPFFSAKRVASLEDDSGATASNSTFSAADVLFYRRSTATDEARRTALGAVDADALCADVRTGGVGVAGAGLMGISIAAAFLGGGFPVLAFDLSDAALATAPQRIERELLAQRRRGGVAQNDSQVEARFVAEIVERLFRTSKSVDELAARPVVVETIPEKTKIKAKFYRELVAEARTPIWLLSNTSSIRISELANALPTPIENANLNRERFCGFHFFHPVSKRSLLEVVRGAETAPETLETAAILGRAIAKTPILVADGPGFLVNRLLQPYLSEGLALLEEGVAPERIEAVCRRFGMEAGPFRIMDEIGLDVSLHAGWSFFKAFPERTNESAALTELVREGKLGRKTKRGFYRFEGFASWEDDATLDFELNSTTNREARTNETLEKTEHCEKSDSNRVSDEELALRVAISILFEGVRLVEDGIVGSFREADAGLVLALGFPTEKAGIFYWAASFGWRRLAEQARRFEKLGARFVAPELARRFLN